MSLLVACYIISHNNIINYNVLPHNNNINYMYNCYSAIQDDYRIHYQTTTLYVYI